MALDAGLISVSVIIPFLLLFFNVLVMAHYIDVRFAAVRQFWPSFSPPLRPPPCP